MMPDHSHPALSLDTDFVASVIADREVLHAAPELSFAEVRTGAFIEDRLQQLGLETSRVGATGIVGVLRNGDGPVLAYRADMDGLPIREQTGLPYASEASGTLNGVQVPVMHACGHDVHMAVALGVARRLVGSLAHWSGTVVFVFQPAEEIGAGAREMVKAGLWDVAPRPQVVLGMHVMPFAAGEVFVPVGTAMSMADSWRVTVIGRGAHGSQPEESVDPIVIGAAIVLRLQTIVAREISPRDTAVVTVGTFHAGLKENVIPDTAELSVNVRTFDPSVRTPVLAAIRRIVCAEAAAAGAPEPRIESISEFPECFNDPAEARRTIDDMRLALGVERVHECEPHMASEDFGVLARSIGVPSVYWFLGGTPASEPDQANSAPVNHSPRFAPVSQPTLEGGVRSALATLLARLSSPVA